MMLTLLLILLFSSVVANIYFYLSVSSVSNSDTDRSNAKEENDANYFIQIANQALASNQLVEGFGFDLTEYDTYFWNYKHFPSDFDFYLHAPDGVRNGYDTVTAPIVYWNRAVESQFLVYFQTEQEMDVVLKLELRSDGNVTVLDRYEIKHEASKEEQHSSALF
jgi:hypothetical protein